MTWIRSPWWDGFWILSGLPIGVLLLLSMYAPAIGMAFFAAAIVLETGHVLSPIVLTWTHGPLRQRALAEWPWWIALPLLILTGVFFVPVPVLFGVYWTWNIYHFGMQHFGVMQLYRRGGPRSADSRARDGLLCLGLTTLGMGVLPFVLHDDYSRLVLTGVFSFNHWLTDIGLSSRVSRHYWLFIVAVLLMGAVGFLWLIPRTDHIATRLIPGIIIARWGVGFVHFLYSRWVWQLSDPRVRATIGQDLLRQRGGTPCEQMVATIVAR